MCTSADKDEMSFAEEDSRENAKLARALQAMEAHFSVKNTTQWMDIFEGLRAETFAQ